jgi:hypothetical protein
MQAADRLHEWILWPAAVPQSREAAAIKSTHQGPTVAGLRSLISSIAQ